MFIIQYKKILLIIGMFVMLASMAIVSVFGLNLGIDFTGGSLTEVAYNERPDKEMVEQVLDTLELGEYSLRGTVNESGQNGYILRTRDLSEAERVSVSDTLIGAGEGGSITRFTSIGPTIGQELKDKAVWAIGAVALIIVLYVAFAFSGVSRPVGSFVYGGITIFVLLHDVLVPTALMSILGVLIGAEVDVLFVMALLAVLGYSVNDTIVVFDRVRENLNLHKDIKKVKVKEVGSLEREETTYTYSKPFPEIVGEAVSATLSRSINTSLTTLFALGALYFLGGSVTQMFALVLIVGVIAGTYSSICIANPLLIYLAERKVAKEHTD